MFLSVFNRTVFNSQLIFMQRIGPKLFYINLLMNKKAYLIVSNDYPNSIKEIWKDEVILIFLKYVEEKNIHLKLFSNSTS